MGRTNLITHHIKTKHDQPISCPYRRVNPKTEQAQMDQITLWKKQDIIEDSTSEYSFPLIPVPKKDGGIRFCVDYRKLNDVCYRDSFPLPHISDNLYRLSLGLHYSLFIT